LELILYDHNIPETFWLSEANRVNSIYDHHEDKTDGYYTQPIAKNIKTLGSAMTLVAHEYRLHDYLLTQEIRKMILTTILIDTFNFDPKLKNTRWTELD
jgi:inorganic pyrophosphatase/exopolyphosphatase